ncbi:uncharacterized protein LOC113147030 [Cyclospora cayetanensis]|uniref:Uncharacterized protein LOC113147030 n=1 Tax=Cyclospora cayetanensis TaxID=88456 RepID=A0A6P6RWP5_9EIME|nr:uncharacterized protein LOC113147030 [Cyclospora cayetanensis]
MEYVSSVNLQAAASAAVRAVSSPENSLSRSSSETASRGGAAQPARECLRSLSPKEPFDASKSNLEKDTAQFAHLGWGRQFDWHEVFGVHRVDLCEEMWPLVTWGSRTSWLVREDETPSTDASATMRSFAQSFRGKQAARGGPDVHRDSRVGEGGGGQAVSSSARQLDEARCRIEKKECLRLHPCSALVSTRGPLGGGGTGESCCREGSAETRCHRSRLEHSHATSSRQPPRDARLKGLPSIKREEACESATPSSSSDAPGSDAHCLRLVRTADPRRLRLSSVCCSVDTPWYDCLEEHLAVGARAAEGALDRLQGRPLELKKKKQTLKKAPRVPGVWLRLARQAEALEEPVAVAEFQRMWPLFVRLPGLLGFFVEGFHMPIPRQADLEACLDTVVDLAVGRLKSSEGNVFATGESFATDKAQTPTAEGSSLGVSAERFLEAGICAQEKAPQLAARGVCRASPVTTLSPVNLLPSTSARGEDGVAVSSSLRDVDEDAWKASSAAAYASSRGETSAEASAVTGWEGGGTALSSARIQTPQSLEEKTRLTPEKANSTRSAQLFPLLGGKGARAGSQDLGISAEESAEAGRQSAGGLLPCSSETALLGNHPAAKGSPVECAFSKALRRSLLLLPPDRSGKDTGGAVEKAASGVSRALDASDREASREAASCRKRSRESDRGGCRATNASCKLPERGNALRQAVCAPSSAASESAVALAQMSLTRQRAASPRRNPRSSPRRRQSNSQHLPLKRQLRMPFACSHSPACAIQSPESSPVTRGALGPLMEAPKGRHLETLSVDAMLQQQLQKAQRRVSRLQARLREHLQKHLLLLSPQEERLRSFSRGVGEVKLEEPCLVGGLSRKGYFLRAPRGPLRGPSLSETEAMRATRDTLEELCKAKKAPKYPPPDMRRNRWRWLEASPERAAPGSERSFAEASLQLPLAEGERGCLRAKLRRSACADRASPASAVRQSNSSGVLGGPLRLATLDAPHVGLPAKVASPLPESAVESGCWPPAAAGKSPPLVAVDRGLETPTTEAFAAGLAANGLLGLITQTHPKTASSKALLEERMLQQEGGQLQSQGALELESRKPAFSGCGALPGASDAATAAGMSRTTTTSAAAATVTVAGEIERRGTGNAVSPPIFPFMNAKTPMTSEPGGDSQEVKAAEGEGLIESPRHDDNTPDDASHAAASAARGGCGEFAKKAVAVVVADSADTQRAAAHAKDATGTEKPGASEAVVPRAGEKISAPHSAAAEASQAAARSACRCAPAASNERCSPLQWCLRTRRASLLNRTDANGGGAPQGPPSSRSAPSPEKTGKGKSLVMRSLSRIRGEALRELPLRKRRRLSCVSVSTNDPKHPPAAVSGATVSPAKGVHDDLKRSKGPCQSRQGATLRKPHLPAAAAAAAKGACASTAPPPICAVHSAGSSSPDAEYLEDLLGRLRFVMHQLWPWRASRTHNWGRKLDGKPFTPEMAVQRRMSMQAVLSPAVCVTAPGTPWSLAVCSEAA